MIFLDKMKNLKVYKTETFLPTVSNDKKKSSFIYLLSPSYEASKRLMNSPLFVNKLRYQSYYLERNVSYYIGGKFVEEDDTNPDEMNESYEYQVYEVFDEMTAAQRNKLPDSAFGIPSKRKYPLDTESRVRSAIKFFNYCDSEDEAELARNIIKAMKKFGITDVHVSEKNRFSKYYKNPVNEATHINEHITCPFCNKESDQAVEIEWNGVRTLVCPECVKQLANDPYNEAKVTLQELASNFNESDYLIANDHLILFTEDSKYDNRLRRLLYASRIKRRRDMSPIYEKVVNDSPFIKYTFYDIKKYMKKNLFVDLYYYSNAFFNANTWVNKKGFDLYYDFLERLLADKQYKEAGYTKKTIFIPIEEWDRYHNGYVWNYKKDINPISVIYQLLYNNNLSKLIKLFGKNDVVFIGKDSYFKINFPELDPRSIKAYSVKFRSFVTKISMNEPIDPEDIDSSADHNDSPEVIMAKINDKLDINKGIDLTPQLSVIGSRNKSTRDSVKHLTTTTTSASKHLTTNVVNKAAKLEDEEDDENIDKSLLASPNGIINKRAIINKKLALAKKIYDASSHAEDEDQAYENLDDEESAEDDTSMKIDNSGLNDEEDEKKDDEANEFDGGDETVSDLIADIQSNDSDQGGVNISAARSSRLNKLDADSENATIKGKTIKDIIETPEPDVKSTSLPVASPINEWNDLKFINFDKEYNIDRDILLAFKHFAKVSRPLAIKKISVENTSTSEDRIETYTVQFEDYKGTHTTIRLDIPIMEDNRFLLRGNKKSIQIQMQNMPIVKTDIDACQIISNYMKIIVYRNRTTNGRALPITGRIYKALFKYKGSKVKIYFGDASKLSSKYELPIDYISLANGVAKIDTKDFTIYFNQDEIRKECKVIEGNGVPYGYDKNKNAVLYLPKSKVFSYELISLFETYKDTCGELIELIHAATAPSVCAFSDCSIVSSHVPLAVVCGYHVGLRKTLDIAKVDYKLVNKLDQTDRKDITKEYIRFSDGYLVYTADYSSSLLLNGLRLCPTEVYSISEIDNRNMYLEFLDGFGGRLVSDGLDNFYDLMIDPITEEVMQFYKLPSDYITALLYANNLLADNKFVKHTDVSTRRFRRYEIIAVYTYKALADAYTKYANDTRHKTKALFSIKQDAVITKFMTDPTSADDSCINALRDIETSNAVTTKGATGMNNDRAYDLSKRTYDSSMVNTLGISTGFAANVGITRQATIDSNIEGSRGYIKTINGNTDAMSVSKTLTANEALTPFGVNHDDPIRTAMGFIQTAKHLVRTEDSDPLLVTSGADEAMPYLSSDNFAFKAKHKGVVKELTDEYIIVTYDDGTSDYVNLEETIQHNSDGGYFVPLKLDASEKLKVGSKIKEGQVLAYDKYSFSNSLGESDNIAYNNGKLAKVAILNSDDAYEDSGIITESLASKLATRVDLDFDAILEKDATIYSMKKVGDHVEVGESLLVWQDSYQDEETEELVKSMGNIDNFSELGKRVLKSEVTGTITDIRIFRTTDMENLSDSLQALLKNYEKKYNALEKKLKEYGISTDDKIRAHKKLPAMGGKLKKAQDAVLVTFYVEYKDTVGVGDKVVSYNANKQVEKRVIPVGQEPYTEFRPNEHIDAIISEVSIDKRLVTSTLIIGTLNKLMVELDRSVKDILGIKYDDTEP